MRQGGDDDVAIIDFIDRSHFETAATSGVHLHEVVARGDDFGGGSKVWALHKLAKIIERETGII